MPKRKREWEIFCFFVHFLFFFFFFFFPFQQYEFIHYRLLSIHRSFLLFSLFLLFQNLITFIKYFYGKIKIFAWKIRKNEKHSFFPKNGKFSSLSSFSFSSTSSSFSFLLLPFSTILIFLLTSYLSTEVMFPVFFLLLLLSQIFFFLFFFSKIWSLFEILLLGIKTFASRGRRKGRNSFFSNDKRGQRAKEKKRMGNERGWESLKEIANSVIIASLLATCEML